MSTLALSSNLEDYLETIYLLIQEKNAARVRDISKSLSVNYSSVTGALRTLADKGLVNYAPYELVTLTSAGSIVAKDVLKRHHTLQNFLVNVLSIDETAADEAACRMEHCISSEILERFSQFAEYIEQCPKGIANWDEARGFSCKNKSNDSICGNC